MNVSRPTEPVTPEEFEAMEKDERLTYELINGVVMMSPSPSDAHQSVGVNLIIACSNALKGKTHCRPTYELDIKFKGNICRPDIMIRCQDNPEIPIIIFEIVSPTSKRRDYVLKAAVYAESGAAEYWVIDIESHTVTVHDYANDDVRVYTPEATIISKAIPEIAIAVADIFA